MRHKVLGFFRAFLVFSLAIFAIHVFLLVDRGVITGYSIYDELIVESPILVPLLAILSLIVFMIVLRYRKKSIKFDRHIRIKNLKDDSDFFNA